MQVLHTSHRRLYLLNPTSVMQEQTFEAQNVNERDAILPYYKSLGHQNDFAAVILR